MAIITANVVHPFHISIISPLDISIVLGVAFPVDVEADILVGFSKGKIIVRDSVWTSEIVYYALRVTNASVSDARYEPCDTG